MNVKDAACLLMIYVKEYAAREYIISWRTESLQAVRILSGLFSRVGINADRCGIYLKLDEFRELSDRQNILEGLHSGDVCAAKKLLEIYEVQYGNNCFQHNFVHI